MLLCEAKPSGCVARVFAGGRLEDLIPLGYILRKIDRWIDFSIIHEKTEDLCSSPMRKNILW